MGNERFRSSTFDMGGPEWHFGDGGRCASYADASTCPRSNRIDPARRQLVHTQMALSAATAAVGVTRLNIQDDVAAQDRETAKLGHVAIHWDVMSSESSHVVACDGIEDGVAGCSFTVAQLQTIELAAE